MSGLEFLTEHPVNAGVPLACLDGRALEQDRSYIRNSFASPAREDLAGEIDIVMPGRPSKKVTEGDLAGLPPVDIEFVLECAGNGRSLIRPSVDGLAWGFGGVSPIRVGGVRLADLLGELPAGVAELVITGADHGEVHPEGDVNYQFSVSRERVADGSALLVTKWGGEPLGLDHGGPLRFMLPGDYAMKSVKWVTRIEGVTQPFTGHFVERYRYLGDVRFAEGAPVGVLQIRSVIASPTEGETVPGDMVMATGSAWSGGAPIADVSVSTNGGETWLKADLEPGAGLLSAVGWRCEIRLRPGRHTLMARATDADGEAQPKDPPWNARGYANNMIQRVSFEVSGLSEK